MSTTIYNNNAPSSNTDPINHNHNNNNIGGNSGVHFSSEDDEYDDGQRILAGEEEVVTSNSVDIENDVDDQHYNNVYQEEEVETEELTETTVGDFTISNNSHDTSTEPEGETPANNQYHGYNNEQVTNDIGISRAGRVRKKNTLLAGYEFDTTDTTPSSRKYKNEFRKQKRPGSLSPDISDPPPKKRGRGRPRKSHPKYEEENVVTDGIVQNPYFDGDVDADLEIDLPTEFEEVELPEMAAEEIIDDIPDPEDLAHGIVLNSSSRLKSQAESAYMMERTANHRRSTNHNTTSSSSYISPTSSAYGSEHKFKLPKKERPDGHKRVTGYILWVQEQKKNFYKNYPSMDFNIHLPPTKLAEKWNALSTNQKKLWKSKASKTMKGGAGDNIKNSAKIIPKRPPGKRGRKSKLELLQIQAAKNASPPVPAPPAPPKVPGKRGRKRKYYDNASGLSSTHYSSQTGQVPAYNSSPVNGSPFSNQFGQSRRSFEHSSMSQQTPGTSRQSRYSPKKEIENPTYKVTGHAPKDIAAHLSLLGESLSNISDRLMEHGGENISGTLSVLLDAFVCATGPLLCLTTQVKELNCVPPERLDKMLECFAINMPDA